MNIQKLTTLILILVLISCEKSEFIPTQEAGETNKYVHKTVAAPPKLPMLISKSTVFALDLDYQFYATYPAKTFGVSLENFKKDLLQRLNFTGVKFYDIKNIPVGVKYRTVILRHLDAPGMLEKDHHIFVDYEGNKSAPRKYINIIPELPRLYKNKPYSEQYEYMITRLEAAIIISSFQYPFRSPNCTELATKIYEHYSNKRIKGDGAVTSSGAAPILVGSLDLKSSQKSDELGTLIYNASYIKARLYYSYVESKNTLISRLKLRGLEYGEVIENNRITLTSLQRCATNLADLKIEDKGAYFKRTNYVSIEPANSYNMLKGFTVSAEVDMDEFILGNKEWHQVILSKVSPNRDFVLQIYSNTVDFHFAHGSTYYRASYKLKELPTGFIKITGTVDNNSLKLYFNELLKVVTPLKGKQPLWTGKKLTIGNLYQG
ncbi:MAG: LamG domain-containing protein, partial [Bacteroidales bacterium]|nr:LamG domain-containing protein [Bacteroidales bacterium]